MDDKLTETDLLMICNALMGHHRHAAKQAFLDWEAGNDPSAGFIKTAFVREIVESLLVQFLPEERYETIRKRTVSRFADNLEHAVIK